jgi:hypothetical protein
MSGIAFGIHRTRLRQHRSHDTMTPRCAAVDHFWRCRKIIWAGAFTAKMRHRTDCCLRILSCIRWSRKHATEYERDRKALLSFHVIYFLPFVHRKRRDELGFVPKSEVIEGYELRW